MAATSSLASELEGVDTWERALEPRAFLAELLSDPTAVVGLVILAVMFTVAVACPLIAPHDPNAINVLTELKAPSFHHLLGTDQLGRDEFSRVVYGARVSLLTSSAVGIVILVTGVTIGTLSGLAGGWVDGLIMRVVDVLLAFPSLLLALAVSGTLGPGLLNLSLSLAAVWWVDYARLVRGLVLEVKERPFIEGAQALGVPPRLIAFRHVLPNIAAPVIVLATLQTGRLLLALAALSFLGLGVAPPTAEWGAMLNDGKNYLYTAPQLMLYPGLAITLTALGFNLLGDGVRDVLDPRLK